MANCPLTIGLVQINNSFSGQNYLPYSVACLQGYIADKAPDTYRFLSPIYRRQPINEIVEHLHDADVVGFSTYVWNAEISLEVARRLKEKKPEVLVVFGGPQVPDDPEIFLRDHSPIDVVVHNEGERTFLQILESGGAGEWSTIDGVSYIDKTGVFIKTQPARRFRDLAEVPSPYVNGIFDTLIAENPDESWIGLWETNRGCPFQCTFCDWGSATASKVTKFELDRLYYEIEWFAKNKIEYIFVCDANFGIQKRDVEIAQYVAKIHEETGYPHGFSVQNTKNATERAYLTQKILADAGLNKGVALSMQSLDKETLRHIKRDNISLDTYLELARRFTRDKVETYSDLILGLPGETYDTFLTGIDKLVAAGQHNRIQFNNLSILPNAEMANPVYAREHGIRTVRSEIINIHGAKEHLADDVPEFQDLVVATKAMPKSDWRRVRATSWMTAFLHFDKIMQIPIILAHELSDASFRSIVETFMNVKSGDYPLLAEVRDFFVDEAASIQNGGAEYVYSEKWLGIYWPTDEYIFIKLTNEGRVKTLYEESGRLLKHILAKASDAHHAAMEDAIRLNRALLSQPFAPTDTWIELQYNVHEVWQGARVGEPARLKKHPYRIRVERSKSYYDAFQPWCREVVWWGNKKGAYLYNNRVERGTTRPVEKQLAGHF